MIHFTISEKAVATFSGGVVMLKMTLFSDFVHHVGLVLWDAGLAGIAGLLVVHYGKILLPMFDKWVAKQFKRLF